MKKGKVVKEWEKFNELADMCQSRAFNFSLTWQKMTGWSVEIYIGYSDSSYEKKFFSDRHLKKGKAIKRALKYMKNIDDRDVPMLGTPQY